MNKKVIIYGLGTRYFNNQLFFQSTFNIVAFCDKNNDVKQKLKTDEKFIELKEIHRFCDEIDFIIICCRNSKKAKTELYWTLEGTLDWNKIILADNILKRKISWNKYCADMKHYTFLNTRNAFKISKEEIMPCLNDIDENAGTVDGHYFLQDIWFAQKVLSKAPAFHFDIGSRIDGFISHLLVMRQKVTMIDIRPLPFKIENLQFTCADATLLSNIPDDSVSSLSCLHALEHFGLGRYGDDINPEACFIALKSISRIAKIGSYLYLSVPVESKDKLCFNGHRIFNPLTIIKELPNFELIELSYIHDYKIIEIYKKDNYNFMDKIKNLPGYCCGMFIFKKLS